MITVLGIGNLLCGDDAFGVHVVERLYSFYEFFPEISIIDGGTQGSTLYGFIEDSEKLLVVDAVDFDKAAGTLSLIDKADIPVWLGMNKLSPHQNSFSENLALASLKNRLPAEMCLLGIQPSSTNFGESLSLLVQSKIPEAINLCLEVLSSWGIKNKPVSGEKHLINMEMQKKVYPALEQPFPSSC